MLKQVLWFSLALSSHQAELVEWGGFNRGGWLVRAIGIHTFARIPGFPAEYCAGKWSASSLSGLIVEADQYKYTMK